MGTSEQRPLRILGADDSAVMRSILWKLFLLHKEDRSSELPRMELCGIARDGVECLEQVKQLCPDVLVLDLEMPRLNGLENSELPVIMCSAYTEHGARSTLEALARGASDYVTKPSEQRNFDAAMLSLSQQLLPRVAALAKDAWGGVEKAAVGALPDNLQKAKVGEGSTKPSSPLEIVVIGVVDRRTFGVGTAVAEAAERFSGAGVDCAAHAEVVHRRAGGAAGQMLRSARGTGL
jgi:two-component system chemotaxis response regulator CheB